LESWTVYGSPPAKRHWVIQADEQPAGLLTLLALPSGEVEVVTFGLTPGYRGQGLGGYALTLAVDLAWTAYGYRPRVWLHTNNFDHPNALSNYERRGFVVVNREVLTVAVPDEWIPPLAHKRIDIKEPTGPSARQGGARGGPFRVLGPAGTGRDALRPSSLCVRPGDGTTPTDTRSQRSRTSRRGGQLLTRAPGGRLYFDSRDPDSKAWESWKPADSRHDIAVGDRTCTIWTETTGTRKPDITVDFTHCYEFSDGVQLTSEMSLRFRDERSVPR
jgi:hypothetical protein